MRQVDSAKIRRCWYSKEEMTIEFAPPNVQISYRKM